MAGHQPLHDSSKPSRRRRWPRILLTLAFLSLVAAATGFLWFVRQIESQESQTGGRADAIVAFTGGAQRIADAVSLLAEGRGKRLLISGVNIRVTRDEIVRANPDLQRWVDCCVDLDYRARNTIGNAIETRRWLREHDFSSLLVVTSNYHMPRSLLELSHVVPNTVLIPHPVVIPGIAADTWWSNVATARLLGAEYVKYVVTLARTLIEADPEGSRVAIIIGGRKPSATAPSVD